MMKEGIVQMICSNMKDMLKHLPRDMNCDRVSVHTLRKIFSDFFLKKNSAPDFSILEHSGPENLKKSRQKNS